MEKQTNFETDLNPDEILNLTQEIADQTESIDKDLAVTKGGPAGQKYYNRSQRRRVIKMIEQRQKRMNKSSGIDMIEWKQKVATNIRNGKGLQERYDAMVMEDMEVSLQEKEARIRLSLVDRGLSKKEINTYIEDWYTNMKIWKEEAV